MTTLTSGKEYYNNITPEKYLDMEINGWCRHARCLADLVSETIMFESEVLVELGCGAGESLEFFVNEKIYDKYIVCDSSSSMCLYTENTYREKGCDITSFVADLEKDKLQIEDNSVDTVMCAATISYLENIDHIFNEAYRILKVGGIFAFDIIESWPNNPKYFYPNKFGVRCYSHPKQEFLNKPSFEIANHMILQSSAIEYEDKISDYVIYILRKM